MPEMVARCMHSLNTDCVRRRADMNDASWRAYAAAYAQTAARYAWETLDMTDFLCGPDLCPYVIDGRLVMWESNHLTRAVVRYFAPLLDSVLSATLLDEGNTHNEPCARHATNATAAVASRS